MSKISAIIPTHNRENLIERAIKSVQNQTMKIDEIIVVSDGSTDNTNEIVKQMAKKDKRIKLISYYPGHNGNYARNKGIEAATGEYIAFLDDDDEWLPEKTALTMEVFKKNPQIGLVYTAQYCIYYDLNIRYVTDPVSRGDQSKKVFIGTDIGTPSQVIVKKSLLEKTGPFDLKLGALQDYDLWIRCCQITEVDYVKIPCINYYNYSNSNQVSNNTEKYINAINYIRNKYDKEIKKYGSDFEKSVNSKDKIKIARRCLRNENKKEARKYAIESFKIKKNKTAVLVFMMSFFPYNLVLRIRSKLKSARIFW